jgi:broad specificity phosphatase PhoE
MVEFRHLHDGPARFWFMRHGESSGNVKGVPQGTTEHPLTDTGRDQARKAGAWLRGQKIDIIVSSPLSRARETAEIVADSAGVGSPIIVDELTEIDTGILTNFPWKDIPARHPRAYRDFMKDGWEGVEGAERAAALAARAEAGWRVLFHRYAEGRRGILTVSHAGFLQWIIRVTFGHESWMPLIGGAGNCSISCLDVKNEPLDADGFSYYAEWRLIGARPWEGADQRTGPTDTT